MVAQGRRPPGRLSLPGTAGKPCRRLLRFRARHQPWRAQRTTQSCAGHVSSRPREGEAARSGGLPGGGAGPRRQARRRCAGTEGRRTCPAGDCPPAPPARSPAAQDFLARPRARLRDNDTAPRGPLMDLSWTCRRPAVDLTPRHRAGCAGQYPCHPPGESHSQMEGFQAEGGSTPYPHIALCATAPMLISGRRTGRTSSEVQKRCLPPRAAAGPEWPRGQNQA